MKLLQSAAVGILCAAISLGAAPPGVQTMDGHSVDVIRAHGGVDVLLFLRTDCPLGKRYAPELARLAHEFAGRNVSFWLIFPDRTESAADIGSMVRDYQFPGTPVRDPQQKLVKLSRATVAPEAAVFGGEGRLVYHGRIDDRYVDYGKAKPEAQEHNLEDAIRAALAGKTVARPETQAFGCALADVE